MFRSLCIAALTFSSAGLLRSAPCVLDTAANYVANFSGAIGCTIGAGGHTLLFSNFSFVNNAAGPTTGGAAGLINLNPIADANGLGFQITPTTLFSASATGANDIELQFRASVVSGASIINGLYSSITGSAGANGVGGGTAGAATLLENFCRGGSMPPGSCPAGQGGTLIDLLAINGPAAAVTVIHNNVFAPTSALSIMKDVALNGNNGITPTSVTEVKNQILVTAPEPSTAWLAAIGCCALVLFRVVRQPKQKG